MTDATGASNGKNASRMIFWPVFLLVVIVAAFYITSTNREPETSVAFVTADGTPYWDRVLDGANDAADKYGIELRVYQADGTRSNQDQLLSRAMDEGVGGVAVSPVDAVRQTGLLRGIAKQAALVTMDSDSELSDRVCFVGTDNYAAGRVAADLIREALPEGGSVVIVSGPLDKANGRERRQGVIDGLLNRSVRSDEPDPLDAVLRSAEYTIPMTLVDEIDPEQATAQVLEALESGAEIDAIVGLYGYHATAIADAVAQHDPDNGVRIVGFDALPATLEAIENGRVYGVVAQDQYSYGFQSVRVAAEAARGAFYAVPLTRQINYPPIAVTRDTLGEARAMFEPATP